MPRDEAPEEDHEGEGAGKASGTLQEAWCVLKRGAGGEEVSIRESEGRRGGVRVRVNSWLGLVRGVSPVLYTFAPGVQGGSMSSEGDR